MAVEFHGRTISESRPLHDIGWCQSLCAEGEDSFGFVTFGQSAAVGIKYQRVMAIDGHRQLQQFLQQSVQVCGIEQIDAS